MIRFFADKSAIYDEKITLSAQDAAHIRSLRLRPDEFFVVCDGEETDYICKLSDSEEILLKTKERCAIAKIIETRPSAGEPTVKCTVFIAYAKGDRLDYAVQKSVELGAYEINIFPSQRCISTPGDKGEKKISRLQKIALETAKQCGRGVIPNVSSSESFKMSIELATSSDVSILPYESEDKLSLKQALNKGFENVYAYENDAEVAIGASSISISIMTGPEGGFTSQEIEHAKSKGMSIVTLGPRILRCETAPIAALSAIMYHTGNLG